MNRIKISLGNIQVEYEGDQAFIENELLGFVERIIDMGGAVPVLAAPVGVQVIGSASSPADASTNTIASLMGVKTGSDLALAAIARINLVKRQGTAARQDILDEMKAATTYYRESYASNLTAYLDTLVKGKRVNLVARATYALAAGERGRLEEMVSAA
jgi:hypothetical protein